MDHSCDRESMWVTIINDVENDVEDEEVTGKNDDVIEDFLWPCEEKQQIQVSLDDVKESDEEEIMDVGADAVVQPIIDSLGSNQSRESNRAMLHAAAIQQQCKVFDLDKIVLNELAIKEVEKESANVMYRNLKPENFLLVGKD
ncbi:hypothetical protein GH714_031989 [Hevea brasiliensis]|uniref:Uncharacterized protein n=1 Tax=Hevea brasiliensis TaxID=3981 RepID=A0A6A6LH77_HEVBR|nr:hypothetical protein GH714_031989 [Hevea brasiliensis]